jgi:hypothetical protein
MMSAVMVSWLRALVDRVVNGADGAYGYSDIRYPMLAQRRPTKLAMTSPSPRRGFVAVGGGCKLRDAIT